MRTRYSAAAVAGVLAWLGVCDVARAQDAAPAPDTRASPTDNKSYGPEFFAGYSVNNADDMLRLIPGVQAILNEQNQEAEQRGFGSGGARILLNGSRFPGKANEISGNLRRIPSQTVARVELISGQAQGISVNSQGILVNIVLREGESLAGAGAWELNAKLLNEAAATNYDGLVSYKGTLGALTYSLGLERNFWFPSANQVWGDRTREEIYFNPNGTVSESRLQHSVRRQEKWVKTAGLAYDWESGARFELNLFHETRDGVLDDSTAFTRYSPTGAPTIEGRDEHQGLVPELGEITEIGGEYGGALGPGDLRALFVVHRERRNAIDFRNLYTPAGVRELNKTFTDADVNEDIARVSYSVALWPGQSIEFGGEATHNSLQSQLLAFFDADGNGVLDTTPLQISNVEEKRAELFFTHKWTISPALSLDSALNYETSKISSIYRAGGLSSVTPERSLSFPKPRFDLRYRASPQVQYRLRIERTISQLQFGNFVPSLNFENNVIVEGNPFLRPEKTWIVEAGYERRLPGDAGILEARVFYNDVTDAIDRTPVPSPLGVVVAVQGNIPTAYGYGAEVKTSVRLGFLHLPDSLLSLRYLVQDSEVQDPFTGEMRKLERDRNYQFDLSYRQDVRALGGSFGFSWRDTGDAAYSTDMIGPNVVRTYLATEPTLEAFVEKRLVGATVLRIDVQNLSGADERRGRYFSPLATPLAPTLRYETHVEQREIRAAIRLRGRF